MAKAVYTGSAARYTIGPHVFTKDRPEHEVSDEIAKVLALEPTFSIDGKGGVELQNEDAPLDRAVIPSVGFRDRHELKVFADKWLPDLTLNMDRSVPELARIVENALQGLESDAEGEPIILAKPAVKKVIKAGKGVVV